MARDTGAFRAIDAHHLLLGRVDTAGEHAGLRGGGHPGQSRHAARVDTSRRERVEQAASLIVASHAAEERGTPVERGDVGGGVARAAGHDHRRVVLEDEDGRLARDPRHASVEELVGRDVADDHRAAAGEGVDHVEQSLPHRHAPCRRIHAAASITSSAT